MQCPGRFFYGKTFQPKSINVLTLRRERKIIQGIPVYCIDNNGRVLYSLSMRNERHATATATKGTAMKFEINAIRGIYQGYNTPTLELLHKGFGLKVEQLKGAAVIDVDHLDVIEQKRDACREILEARANN